jgi:hypothetical protein
MPVTLQDEDEDWSRWRDVVFRAKGALQPKSRDNVSLTLKPPPPKNKKRRSKGEFVDERLNEAMRGSSASASGTSNLPSPGESSPSFTLSPGTSATALLSSGIIQVSPPVVESDRPQLTVAEALAKIALLDNVATNTTHVTREFQDTETSDSLSQGSDAEIVNHSYCPECYLPLHPDPKPERLYIFLHALKYTTSLGSFETDMPEWTRESWEWEL